MPRRAERERARLQITLDKGLLEEISTVCEKAHMSRSAWIEYTLGMSINAYRELLDGISAGMAVGVGEGVKIEEKALPSA